MSKKTPTQLSTKEIYTKLFKYLKPLLPVFSIAIIASIGYSALDAYVMKLLGPLVDKGLVARESAFINSLPILLASLFLFRGFFSFGSTYAMAWVSRKLVLTIRQDLFAHYLKLPTSFFDKNNTGELLAKIIYNADQLYKACTDIIIDVLREGLLVIFLLAVMLYTSWKLTLVFFIGGPIMGVLFVIVNKIFRRLSYKAQDAIGSVMHNTREALEGQQVIRIFGGHTFVTKKINKILKDYNSKEMRQALIKSISIPTIQFIGGLALALTLYVALSGIVDPNLSAGSFASLFGSMIAILKPIKQVTSMNIYFQRAIAAADGIFSILNLPTENDNGVLELANIKGNIDFNNISFKYETRDGLILDKIDLKIAAKQTVAFVGHSGAGKSTLIKLLPRFYDDYLGEILLDGVDIKNYTLASLRQQIAIVSQHVILFNETIADNICYGATKPIDQEQLIKAVKAAGAYDFISRLPNGFDTLIGENGILLSGGQRQRIAIARAIFKDAPILILDEATSALDTETEREIQLALDYLMSNRTTLVIAHRLSTIIKADQIVVMDKGRIVETGTHAKLLSNGSVYANLYNMQFEQKSVEHIVLQDNN